MNRTRNPTSQWDRLLGTKKNNKSHPLVSALLQRLALQPLEARRNKDLMRVNALSWGMFVANILDFVSLGGFVLFWSETPMTSNGPFLCPGKILRQDLWKQMERIEKENKEDTVKG